MAEFNPDIPIYLVRPDLEVQVCPSCLIRSFCNGKHGLKINMTSDSSFNWVQSVATQHFSQVTNLNVLLPEAFTPRVRKIIFQKALMWHICRGWISNSTATEPMEPTEPTESMELTEPMEQCEKKLPSNMTCKTCYKCNQDLKVYKQTFSVIC